MAAAAVQDRFVLVARFRDGVVKLRAEFVRQTQVQRSKIGEKGGKYKRLVVEEQGVLW
jgi:hypothetical protein